MMKRTNLRRPWTIAITVSSITVSSITLFACGFQVAKAAEPTATKAASAKASPSSASAKSPVISALDASVTPRFSEADVARLAAKIDERIDQKWQEVGVKPAEPSSDSEFVRRVYLDVVGRIPHVAEAREFLADKSADKRQVLVRRLLSSPGYVSHWTNIWRNAYLPEVETDFQFRFLAPSFDIWLKKQLLEDRAYDAWAQELLTAVFSQQQRMNVYGQGNGDPTPLAFYQIKENKPENLAAAVARVYLGVRIECAQCHDHPFAKWKREDFWSMAAFFRGSENAPRGGTVEGFFRDLFTLPEISIPDTKKTVQARFIDGSKPHFKGKVSFRQTLADWVTSINNPYFAKATVNRLWGQFFGRGLVDPIDDLDEANPASHPKLLDDLAEAFAKQEYDLKFIVRAITASRTYQLSSRQTHQTQGEPRLFARAGVRGLTGEQLYDSVATATGYRDPNGAPNPFAFGGNSPRSEFLEKFKAGAENPSDRQTSIVQALMLMNGPLTTTATNPNQSETLAAVAEFPLFSTAERIEALYLAALTRKPTETELARLTKYVDDGGPKKSSRDALADVFWSLLNSSEFVSNH